MPDDNANLARRIEELEALLAEQRINTGNGETPQRASNIPVLDDVVTPEDYRKSGAEQQGPADEKITELAQRLERKFSMELDETVHVLKSNLRQSILQELNEQMQKDETAGAKPDEPSRGFPED